MPWPAPGRCPRPFQPRKSDVTERLPPTRPGPCRPPLAARRGPENADRTPLAQRRLRGVLPGSSRASRPPPHRQDQTMTSSFARPSRAACRFAGAAFAIIGALFAGSASADVVLDLDGGGLLPTYTGEANGDLDIELALTGFDGT